MGKTEAMTEAIQEIWGVDATVFLETETAIFSRARRREIGATGCSPRSYDLSQYSSWVRDLSKGKSVKVPKHEFTFEFEPQSAETESRLPRPRMVLDGSVTALPEVSLGFDRVLFFIPVDYKLWLEFAIRRDLGRGWSAEQSADFNPKKARDVWEIYRQARSNISHTVFVRVQDNGRILEYSAQRGPCWSDGEKEDFEWRKQFID